MGSDPGDNTKMTGVTQFESSNDFARSNGGGSIYLRPNSFRTKSWTAGTI